MSAATQNYYFSSGKIRYGAPGAVLTDADNVAAIEDVTFTSNCQTAEVREAAHINMHPVADAQYDAVTTLQFKFTSVDLDLLPYVTGATKATAGGYVTYSAGATSKPQYLQTVFVGIDTTGKEIQIIIPRGKATEFPLSFSRTGFVSPQVTVTSFPDKTASNGTELAWNIRKAL